MVWEGAVARALDREGGGDFWQLARDGYLVHETRNYVPMIHAAIVVRVYEHVVATAAPAAPNGGMTTR